MVLCTSASAMIACDQQHAPARKSIFVLGRVLEALAVVALVCVWARCRMSQTSNQYMWMGCGVHLIIELTYAKVTSLRSGTKVSWRGELWRCWDALFVLPHTQGTTLECVCVHFARLNAYFIQYSGFGLVLCCVYPMGLPSWLLRLYRLSPLAAVQCTVTVLLLVPCFCLLTEATSHRYFSHSSFKTSRPMQLILGLMAAASGQAGPMWWASIHRGHHHTCDTEHDPHSPSVGGFLYAHLMWMVRSKNFLIETSRLLPFRTFPELLLCDVFFPEISDFFMSCCRVIAEQLFARTNVLLALLSGTMSAAGAASWEVPPEELTRMQGAAIDFAWVLSFHAIFLSNSWCHFRGGAKDECNADDVRWVALLNAGSGWHNCHHHDPKCAYLGTYAGGFDLAYYFICALERAGLVWGVRHKHMRPETISGPGKRKSP